MQDPAQTIRRKREELARSLAELDRQEADLRKYDEAPALPDSSDDAPPRKKRKNDNPLISRFYLPNSEEIDPALTSTVQDLKVRFETCKYLS